jgi:hypothetical protein
MKTQTLVLLLVFAWLASRPKSAVVLAGGPPIVPLPPGAAPAGPPPTTITLPPDVVDPSGNVYDDSAMLQQGYACAWDNQYSSSVGECYGWQAQAYFLGVPNFRWLDPSFGRIG